ncbi:hypothetical protein JXJ21_04870 [candidate division KSB1 bacterium]|nr:hypothetical protein [candidate division KSB1 bacterium]
MKLSAPKEIVWWIALVLTVVGLLMVITALIPNPLVGIPAFWFAFVPSVLLLLATLLKGL